jgi:hypothetical protein
MAWQGPPHTCAPQGSAAAARPLLGAEGTMRTCCLSVIRCTAAPCEHGGQPAASWGGVVQCSVMWIRRGEVRREGVGQCDSFAMQDVNAPDFWLPITLPGCAGTATGKQAAHPAPIQGHGGSVTRCRHCLVAPARMLASAHVPAHTHTGARVHINTHTRAHIHTHRCNTHTHT